MVLDDILKKMKCLIQFNKVGEGSAHTPLIIYDNTRVYVGGRTIVSTPVVPPIVIDVVNEQLCIS